MLKTRKLITAIALSGVLGSNVLAEETVSSQAIYDSQTKTLSLEGILVPFIDEFTGKETDNKGIFDAQLQEKNKLIFELIPWSITNKNMFNGDDTSGYILYDHKTRSVNIPCFQVVTTAIFGDAIEGETIYYKDVSMKQRHVAYPIFHVEDMTETDSCDITIINKPIVEVPKTTNQNTVTAKIKAPVGSQIIVNGSNTGVTIPESGEANIALDTSGADGNKTFAIKFIDIDGVESDDVNVTIEKKAITSFATSFSGVYKPDDNNIVEFIAQSDGLKPVDMTIKWDDNTIEKVEVAIGDTKTISHTYNDNENKNIYMKGYVGVLNSKGKIQDVKRWGKDTKFVYMRNMFDTYQNSGWNATDTPNTTYVTNMYHMFYNANSFSNNDLSTWNVSNVTNHEGFSTSWGSTNIEPDWNREYPIKLRKGMINLSQTTGEGNISFEFVKYRNNITPAKDMFNDPNIEISIEFGNLEPKNSDLSMITGTLVSYFNVTYYPSNESSSNNRVLLTQKTDIPAFSSVKVLDVNIKVQATEKSSKDTWYAFMANISAGERDTMAVGSASASITMTIME
jgi:hypothetical protein